MTTVVASAAVLAVTTAVGVHELQRWLETWASQRHVHE
jgi:hypothetical protein